MVRAARPLLTVLLAVAAASVGAPAAAQVRFHGEAAGASVQVMSWRDIPFRTVVRQKHDFSCGSAALATLLTYHYGRPTTEPEAFKEMFAKGDQAKIQKVGFSMLDMKRYLADKGLQADGFRMTLDDIDKDKTPVIALIVVGTYRHFVVIKGVMNGKVLVGDPALGLKTFARADFEKMWNGVVFSIHDANKPLAFNQVSDWSPWSVAPVSTAQGRSISELTNDQLTLYQISPARVVDLVAATGGLAQ